VTLFAQASATGLEPTLERTLDLIGVFAFAISGGLLAVRKGFELVGVTSLALVTALGGGVARDLLLGATPPTAFSEVLYLVVALAAAAVVFLGHWMITRTLNRAVLIFDAAGLGLFCVTGAIKASTLGASLVGAILIGVISAAGGGIIRDVLANEPPSLFHCMQFPLASERRLSWLRGATAGTRVAWRLGWPSQCSRSGLLRCSSGGAHRCHCVHRLSPSSNRWSARCRPFVWPRRSVPRDDRDGQRR
jgi:uncharacterized membrane protein YeiH